MQIVTCAAGKPQLSYPVGGGGKPMKTRAFRIPQRCRFYIVTNITKEAPIEVRFENGSVYRVCGFNPSPYSPSYCLSLPSRYNLEDAPDTRAAKVR